MNRRARKIGRLIGFLAVFFVLSGCGGPDPASSNATDIDTDEGCFIGDVEEGEMVPVKDGILEGIIPMAAFDCSGRVYKVEGDSQDGFTHSVTLVFGKLAAPDVFSYLVDDGRMNKRFNDDFVLDNRYFKSHIIALYVHSATKNLEELVSDLKVGDTIRMKGDFVYLQTANGLIKTSLNPEEFKCKYTYLSEVDTVDSVYY